MRNCGFSIQSSILTGQGAAIDTTTVPGRLSFGIFAALAEFESELIRERTMAGLQREYQIRGVKVADIDG